MRLIRRFGQWRKLRPLRAERRKLIRSLRRRRHYWRAAESEASSEEIEKFEEDMEALDDIHKGFLLLDWLDLRSRSADLGLFVNWGDDNKILHGDDWRDLMKKEMSDLKESIRDEKNKRWQYWELRLKVLTAIGVALTGTIGATIGLIAMLRK